MPILDLRARTIPELFDAGFALARECYAPLVTLAALAYVPRLLAYAAFPTTSPGIAYGRALWVYGWGAVGAGAMIVAASARYHGDEARPGDAIAATWRRTISLFVAGVYTLVMTMLGFLLLVYPGLVLLRRYFAVVPAIVIEGLSLRQALLRSARLSEGHAREILIVTLLPPLVVVPLTLAMQHLLAGLGASARANVLTTSIIGVLISPLFAAITTALYYDVRIRREGYDLELLAKSAASAGREGPTHPAADAPSPSGS